MLKWFGEALNESLGAAATCQPLQGLHWEVVGQRTCRVCGWEAAPAQLGGLPCSKAELGRCWGGSRAALLRHEGLGACVVLTLTASPLLQV